MQQNRFIIVWPSSLHLLNNGDAAMLQATVQRLKKFLPHHRILVFVQRSDLLEKYCPGAEPLDPQVVDLGQCRSLIPERRLRLMPRSLRRWARLRQRAWLARWPRSYASLANTRARLGGMSAAGLGRTIELLARTDAIVSTGGGFINDSFPSVALRIMDDLLAGASLAIPIAMFGQGLGPVEDTAVLRMASELFPKLSLVGLREGRQGFVLASQWMGGTSSRIRITGDDAIEPPYRERRAETGDSIGINMRVAEYSGVSPAQSLRIFETLRAAAATVPAPLVPIVISRHPKDSDAESLRALMPDHPLLRGEDGYDSPEKVASAVARCRLVVTGSYHAGVFALAQGIPVIGLSSSAYYDGKFLGLRDQFGGGVEVLQLDQPDMHAELLRCIRATWDSAPDWREPLLAAARKQIELSECAYRDFAASLNCSEPTAEPESESLA
jgi:colanic acid/amylovoran biosynthesis protein